MKKIIAIMLLMLTFSSCALDLNAKFKEFALKDSAAKIELPSGTYATLPSIERDKNEYHIIVDFLPYVKEESYYTWYAMPLEIIRSDMEYMAELAIDFGVNEDWDGRYYLYIKAFPIGVNYVYDYEANKLYYSKNREIYIEMFSQFGTMNYKDIIDSDEGKQFLLAKGLAKEQHEIVVMKEFEIVPTIYIIDGEFSDYWLEGAEVFWYEPA